MNFKLKTKINKSFSQLAHEATPFALGVPALLWQGIFFYVPLLFVVVLSFSSWSFEYFMPFFAWDYGYIIIRTLCVALLTACSCLVLAYPVAYWIVFHARRWKNTLLFFLFMPFWTTFLLHVYAWMFVLERGGVINTILQKIGIISEPLHILNTTFAVVLMMIYCYLPFMILPIYSSLEKFDHRLFEASSDLGATWWQTFWRVVVPVSLPGIRSGFFLVLVPAFGEFAIPELIGGDKKMFVGTVVTHYTMGAKTASLGAAFTLLTAVVLLVVVLMIYGITRKIFRQ
jgi:spermidine/putrescine transport system permease protein